jgi:hypothetical protein
VTPERAQLLRTLFKNVLLSAIEEMDGARHNAVWCTVYLEMKKQFNDKEIWDGLNDLFPEIARDL